MIRRNDFRKTGAPGLARRVALASVLTVPLLVAGCINELHTSELDAPHELGVELVRMHHAVPFRGDIVQVAEPAKDALSKFMGRTGYAHGDEIILTPVGGDLYGQQARVEAVAGLFEAQRIRTRQAPAQTRITGVEGPAILVTIERHNVVLPDCPDWQKPATQNWKNLPMPNFGCSTQTNLGLMVANPRDLKYGQEMGPADAARTTLGIERYRAGEEDQLVQESIAVE